VLRNPILILGDGRVDKIAFQPPVAAREFARRLWDDLPRQNRRDDPTSRRMTEETAAFCAFRPSTTASFAQLKSRDRGRSSTQQVVRAKRATSEHVGGRYTVYDAMDDYLRFLASDGRSAQAPRSSFHPAAAWRREAIRADDGSPSPLARRTGARRYTAEDARRGNRRTRGRFPLGAPTNSIVPGYLRSKPQA